MISKNTGKFKYALICSIVKYIKNTYILVKSKFIKQYQALKLSLSKVEWGKVQRDILLWLSESFVEGLTANFATHYLFGVDFSFALVFAHGFAIKQSLSIYRRLKKDGSTTTIPKN